MMRKTITGTHTGNLMGIPATWQQIAIDVIDIVKLRDERYVEHWASLRCLLHWDS